MQLSPSSYAFLSLTVFFSERTQSYALSLITSIDEMKYLYAVHLTAALAI